MICEKCGEDKPTREEIDREGRIIYICGDCLRTEELHKPGRIYDES